MPSEFLVRSLRDKEFRAYLQSTDLNVADGIGVLWAARFLTLSSCQAAGGPTPSDSVASSLFTLEPDIAGPSSAREPIPERIRGLDALFVMLEAAEDVKAPVYFLGARAEVNEGARQKIKARYPGLVIAGGRDGYSQDPEAILRDIDESRAALLVVALGSPKQEYWIRDNLHKLQHVRVAVGEGGTLDLIAGDYRLTPGWLQTVGLEWLWRLLMHRRNKSGGASRARRVWNAVPVFIYQGGQMEAEVRAREPRSAGISMKNIAVLYSGGRQWGGIETYLANLFRLHDRAGWSLVLVSMGEWELTQALEQEGLSDLVRLLSHKRIRLCTVCDIRRLVRDERIGLIVSQGTVANAYARTAALVSGVPSLVVVHSDMRLDYPSSIRWAFTLSDRLLRPVTKRYVTVSQDLKNKLVGTGVKEDRVTVIYNGVNTVGRPSRAEGADS